MFENKPIYYFPSFSRTKVTFIEVPLKPNCIGRQISIQAVNKKTDVGHKSHYLTALMWA